MKKFLLLFFSLSTLSLFATPFSLNEYNQILKSSGWDKAKKYCYQAELSEETNYQQAYAYVNYYAINVKKHKITKQQLLEAINKFKPYINENGMKLLTGYYLAYYGYQKQALQLRPGLAIYIGLANYFYRVANWEKYWQYAEKILLMNGGCENVTTAYDTLIKMFRFKPASITKEQQIEFLNKLSNTYPIPGTDFNTWKPFMGFVGYKYKALTGKDLF